MVGARSKLRRASRALDHRRRSSARPGSRFRDLLATISASPARRRCARRWPTRAARAWLSGIDDGRNTVEHRIDEVRWESPDHAHSTSRRSRARSRSAFTAARFCICRGPNLLRIPNPPAARSAADRAGRGDRTCRGGQFTRRRSPVRRDVAGLVFRKHDTSRSPLRTPSCARCATMEHPMDGDGRLRALQGDGSSTSTTAGHSPTLATWWRDGGAGRNGTGSTAARRAKRRMETADFHRPNGAAARASSAATTWRGFTDQPPRPRPPRDTGRIFSTCFRTP